jgi:DNA-binding LacI/PurR family transcriptional regulator
VPSLSSIDPDHDAMAKTAVSLLIQRIAGRSNDPRDYVSGFRVVERESTAPRR